MADAQDKGATDGKATDDTGAESGQSEQKTEKAGKKEEKKVETFTAEQVAQQVESETDRRIEKAQKKWKADLDAAMADTAKTADEKLTAIQAASKKEKEELSAKVEEAEMKANFLQDAHESGIQSVDAAFLVASHGGYIKRGRLQLAKFKEDYPLFFATKAATANAGEGAEQTNTGGGTASEQMDIAIRSSAGRPPRN